MLVYFSLTLFVSATLLFLVQPLIGKMILPHLGGTPAVWNTCMVFFQGLLLIGYGYTHLLTTTQAPRRQALIQVVMLCLPFLVLPFALGDWEPRTDGNPVFSLLAKLVVMVGLPFFAVSTTAPLLQKWFAHTGHPAAKDPYFLYGASNLGSMVGLALYPSVIEPWLPVVASAGESTWETQVHLWTAGFALFAGMVLVCAIVVWTSRGVALDATPTTAVATTDTDITLARRLRWIALAAVPSSLMLGVTTHLTTDIAAIAFFWILPLALYLLTFILVFARWPIEWTGSPHRVMLYVQPPLVLLLVYKMISHVALPMWVEFLLHLSAFVSTTLVCHGELARDRPAAKHLTEFYFWMSLGGVLGGLFNALFAPLVFQFGIWEYPIALAAACLLRSNLVGTPRIPDDSTPDRPTRLGSRLDWVIPILMGVGTVLLIGIGNWMPSIFTLWRSLVLVLPVAGALLLMWRPMRLGLAVAALFLAVGFLDRRIEPFLYEGRGFFGLVRVRSKTQTVHPPALANADAPTPEHKTYRILVHGGINHGGQIFACTDAEGNVDAAKTSQHRRTPITYFHERNGVAEVYHKLSWPDAQRGDKIGATIGLSDARMPASLFGLAMGTLPIAGMLCDTQSEPPVAVIGLGSGILGCYAKPFQRMDFFEIDPLVSQLVERPDYHSPWHLQRKPSSYAEPTFTFLYDAQERGARTDIYLGDGRLKIKAMPDRYYHVISLDAFSSDAIPVHLLTVEAIDLYLSKLADDGVLIFNTTNGYVRMEGVLAAIARERGLDCLHCSDRRHDLDHPERMSADWVVLQRRVTKHGNNGGPPIRLRLEKERIRLAWNGQPVRDAEGNAIVEPRWRDVTPHPGPIWTDRYSNLLDPHVMPWLAFWRR